MASVTRTWTETSFRCLSLRFGTPARKLEPPGPEKARFGPREVAPLTLERPMANSADTATAAGMVALIWDATLSRFRAICAF